MTTMHISKRATSILMLTAALCLTACGKKAEPVSDVVEDNMITEMPIEDAGPVNSVEIAPPPPAPVNVTNTVAPPPAFTDKEQMRDDADATGLTSRLPSDDATAGPANEIQPAR